MTNKYEQAYKKCRQGRPSSYGMQDSALVFDELKLGRGDVFLDIGCGIGDYAIHAARLVSEAGHVYALDKSQDLVVGLREKADAERLTNITAYVANAKQALPIVDGAVDVCFLATVLHIPEVTKHANFLFSEIRRVLKPGGYAAIIECSKKDLTYGPPEEMRLSPDEIEAITAQCGFRKLREVDFGFNYMITMVVAERNGENSDSIENDR